MLKGWRSPSQLQSHECRETEARVVGKGWSWAMKATISSLTYSSCRRKMIWSLQWEGLNGSQSGGWCIGAIDWGQNSGDREKWPIVGYILEVQISIHREIRSPTGSRGYEVSEPGLKPTWLTLIWGLFWSSAASLHGWFMVNWFRQTLIFRQAEVTCSLPTVWNDGA